jgi:hypothetical protein
MEKMNEENELRKWLESVYNLKILHQTVCLRVDRLPNKGVITLYMRIMYSNISYKLYAMQTSLQKLFFGLNHILIDTLLAMAVFYNQ